MFIDGCFWHSCPMHGHSPKSNTEYWVPKLRRNRERDSETVTLLEANGWTVLRFWEHLEPLEIADAIVVMYQTRLTSIVMVEKQDGSTT